VFISPFGISMALSMVYQGAESDTREEMAKVLGYEGLDIEEVNKSYKLLLKYFNELIGNVKLKNSNSIWKNSLKGDVIKEDLYPLIRMFLMHWLRQGIFPMKVL